MSSVLTGRRLGVYDVHERIGAGGMGEVYRAHDTRLRRDVAIKVLPPALMADPDRLARLDQEARVLATLNHPNIATIHGIEQADDVHALVLELISGDTLSDRIGRGPLALKDALTIARQVTAALEAAHERRIVHRDLKPANIKITTEGLVKVLDFGLAKHVPAAVPVPGLSQLKTTEVFETQSGVVLGTAAYMSPEQVRASIVDQRTDLWALGCLFYEMLAGRPAFARATPAETAAAILEREPDWSRLPAALPRQVIELLRDCLRKDPSQRLQEAGAARRRIEDVLTALESRGRVWPRRLVAAAVFTALAAGALAAWVIRREANLRILDAAIARASELADHDQYALALESAEEAERVAPGDPRLAELWARISVVRSVTSDPPGAEVSIRKLTDTTAGWQRLGITPLQDMRLPRGVLRWRIEKDGFSVHESIMVTQLIPESGGRVPLAARSTSGSEMVLVPPSNLSLTLVGYDRNRSFQAGAFLIDKHEVTNEQFKKFVDAGGYARQEYWTQPFLKDGRVLSWEQALNDFRDRTGRPGPATWEVGTYAADHATHPVGGVSWYEAAAYAEFAGKRLPTIYHWTRAASIGLAASIAPFSNLDGKGPAAVGSYQGVSGAGVFDMAGNVREWCWNEMSPGATRYTLGASWSDPPHAFQHPAARSPFDRSEVNGFRLVQYVDGPPAEGMSAALELPIRNYRVEKPASDEVFQVYRDLFSYDPLPLDARVEAVDDSGVRWRHERATFSAAYGGERVIAHLFLPTAVRPPYQTVVYFPGIGTTQQEGSRTVSTAFFEFLLLSGRAVLWPVYRGTLERRDHGQAPIWPDTTRAYQDWLVQWVNDVRRSVDYLESRPDIQRGGLAFFGFSWGADIGTRVLALESRFKTAVLLAGGFNSARTRPEVDSLHFAPRVLLPLLLVNGDSDFVFPLDEGQKPFMDLLGTPREHKRHIVYPGGHDVVALQRNQIVREVLGWLDEHLGPVGQAP